MKVECTQNGTAYLVGVKKAQWVEVGQKVDLDVKRMGGVPKNFEAVEDEKAAAKKAAAEKAAAEKAATEKDAAGKAGPVKAPGAPTTTDL